MAKKTKEQVSMVMDSLLSEEPITSIEETSLEVEPQKNKVGRPRTGEDNTRTSFIVNKTQIAKIRYISGKESIPQKDIVKLAFEDIIRRYEEKHGEIEVELCEEAVRDLEDIF